jgi:tetratricopeptide (TPR) repeat protein
MTEYTAALAIKADEQYPKDRIAEIQGILAEFKARDDAYKASVAKADQFLAEKNYEGARAEYQNAGAIKPSEQYPKDKISEISRILTELQGKKVTYDNLVKSAADLLAEKEYNKSKELYQQASGIFPEEALPKERIAYITRTVDSIYRANKGQYDIAVANGDKAFAAFEFDKAIDAYTEASGYLPMESYPKEQIAKIRRTIAENAIVDVLKTPVTITAGDEKKFTFEPVNIAARKDNFVYLRIRNLSGKQFNILMRYGRDAQANGGVVVRNVSVDGKVNERLISVRDQDLWYRADNNWISLYPQGGDIEVSFIQVSRVR